MRDKNFANAARKYLEIESEDDYYYNEYESGLDHSDVGSLSEMAKFFFEAGKESVKDDKKEATYKSRCW